MILFIANILDLLYFGASAGSFIAVLKLFPLAQIQLSVLLITGYPLHSGPGTFCLHCCVFVRDHLFSVMHVALPTKNLCGKNLHDGSKEH